MVQGLSNRLRGAEDPGASAARDGLLAFAGHVNPVYRAEWFHALIAEHLEAFERGDLPRLIVSMPPQHGKTELVSRLLPAWMLGRRPDLRILAGSYSDSLASLVNMDVQRYIDSEAYQQVFPATRLPAPGQAFEARRRRERRRGSYFEVVGRRGFYRSAGVGVGISGVPADVGIIDDPIKNREEAESATYRDRVWSWFTSSFMVRLRKDSRLLVVMTRWHEDDFVGRLKESAERGGLQWVELRLPALAEEEGRHPRDPRAPGEALWPVMFPAETIAERQRTMTSYEFAGLYQQRPRNPGGSEFDRKLLASRVLDEPVQAPGARRCRAWDCGGTEGAGDWTAGVRVCRLPDGRYVIEDVVRHRVGPAKVDELIFTTAQADGRAVLVREEQEGGSSGKAVIVGRRQRLGELGYDYEGVPSAAEKSIRRLPVRALAEAGKLWLVRGAWNAALLDELEALPNARHDDQSDALALGANTLLALPAGIGGAVPLKGHREDLAAPRGRTLGPLDRVACSGACGRSLPLQRMARHNGGVYCALCSERLARAGGGGADGRRPTTP